MASALSPLSLTSADMATAATVATASAIASRSAVVPRAWCCCCAAAARRTELDVRLATAAAAGVARACGSRRCRCSRPSTRPPRRRRRHWRESTFLMKPCEREREGERELERGGRAFRQRLRIRRTRYLGSALFVGPTLGDSTAGPCHTAKFPEPCQSGPRDGATKLPSGERRHGENSV